MSYSIQEANTERAIDIHKAMQSVDAPDRLRNIARLEQKEGNEEFAAQLINRASRIENMYDEAKGN